MPICVKCFIDKPLDQYYKEVRKENGRTYIKKYCLDCFRAQSREWKLKNRISKRKLEQEEKYKNNPHYKLCVFCKKYKILDDFYGYKINFNCRCKVCELEYQKKLAEEKIKLGFNKNTTYCNTYLNQEQKDELFEFMEMIGWTYNDNGVWSKEGIKTKDKFWPQLIKRKKNEKRTY